MPMMIMPSQIAIVLVMRAGLARDRVFGKVKAVKTLTKFAFHLRIVKNSKEYVMHRLIYASVLAVALGTAAAAGTPVEETVECPVGGEKFEITNTMSCSTMGRTMSFRPVTSCDFITRLPICPSNGLPMYDDFSDEQIVDLTAFVETDEYKALMPLSPWLRAYGVAKHLGTTEAAGFGIMLSAFWQNTDAFLASDTAIDDFLREGEVESERASVEDRPFLMAILAYATAVSGDTAQAATRLKAVRAMPNLPDYLLSYIGQVEACLPDLTADGCRPYDEFEPAAQ